MKEMILVIAILTSTGWAETIVDYKIIPKNYHRSFSKKQSCEYMAKLINRSVETDAIPIKAYCKELL